MPQPVLVHVDDVRPENMKQGEGWAISEFRLPISGRNGASTTLFHSIFRPGSTHAKHRHRHCDEIAVYLRGRGTVGQGKECGEVRPGHCRLMPKGSEHFFHNETTDEEGLVIGFYVGAGSVADTGYEFCGHVGPADLQRPRVRRFSEGVQVHIGDVAPTAAGMGDGWKVTDFRLPIGRHNGSTTSLYWAKLHPGDAQEQHRLENCDTLYYVVDGLGLAGAGDERAEVRGGHVHYVPRGVERFLVNLSTTRPLEVIGVYVGAGSIEETGRIRSSGPREMDRRPPVSR